MINFIPKVTGEQTSTEVTYCGHPCRIYAIEDGQAHLAFFENRFWNVTWNLLGSANFDEIPKPKPTRPITTDDIMKIPSVNPVLYYAHVKEPEIWDMLTRPGDWAKVTVSAYRFSHNPFAANPVIVEPEIEVVE